MNINGVELDLVKVIGVSGLFILVLGFIIFLNPSEDDVVNSDTDANTDISTAVVGYTTSVELYNIAVLPESKPVFSFSVLGFTGEKKVTAEISEIQSGKTVSTLSKVVTGDTYNQLTLPSVPKADNYLLTVSVEGIEGEDVAYLCMAPNETTCTAKQNEIETNL